MGRPERPEVPGGLFHITSRGNNRQRIVLDDIDRVERIRILATVVARYGWILHAWCLMDNHDHLLLETPVPNRGEGMRLLNGRYSRRFNARHGRINHLFGERYQLKEVVRESHLLPASAYVVANHPRARLCAHPADSAWSSFRATAGLEPTPEFLSVDWILGHFGNSAEQARKRYVEYVEEQLAAALAARRKV
jgi:REP element-mobilizing transposase RayT